MEIKFCENNLDVGSEIVAQKLKREITEVPIEIEDCLGCCGDCAQHPFAMVDEEMILADSVDDLYEKVVKHLSK